MASNRSLLMAGCVGSLLALAWTVSAQQPLPALPPPAAPASSASAQQPPPAATAVPGYNPYAPPASNPYATPGAPPAATYPTAPPPAPGMVPAPPAHHQPPGTAPQRELLAAPAPDPGAHLHDGFYLRVGAGLGYLNGKISSDALPGKLTLSGVGLAVDVAAGLSVIPGWVIGGRAMVVTTYNPKLKDSYGTNDKVDATLYMLQFVTDIYPMPAKGLHFMAGVGPMTMEIAQDVPAGQTTTYYYSGSSSDNKARSTASGLALSLGGGWETWVSKQWSLGGLIMLNFAWMEQDLELHTGGSHPRTSYGRAKLSAFLPTLAFTGAFN